MVLVLEQLLLLAAVAALAAAGWRLAAAAAPGGLLRGIGTVALASGGAVLSALALALIGLGASPIALTALAGLICLAAWRVVPATGPSAGEQLTAWWEGLPVAGRAAVLAVAGAFAGYLAWILRYPGLGLDALTYHLALPVAWAHNGRPGSLVVVNDGLQLQNYPLTWEVLVAWFTGIGHTLVPAMLLTPASLVLLGASVRAGLGELGVSWRLAWLAAAALVTLPLVLVQLPGPNNDLPEAAWLACAAALIAGAAPRRGARGGPRSAMPPADGGAENHPALLAVALVAIGLCVGTKTTGAPLAALALVLGGWACRRELRRYARPLALATATAIAIGGVWYLRNLIDHGAPFWPLSTTPWGDPIPSVFRANDASLLGNFHHTLHARTDAYWRVLAGGVILVPGALASILWSTGRAVRWGGVAAAAMLLIWAASPYTGISTTTQLAVGATRYLLPCLLAAAVALALAARQRKGLGGARAIGAEALSAVVLLGALGVNLWRDQALGFPNAPTPRLVLLSALAGAAVALAADALIRVWHLGLPLARWGAKALAVIAAVLALVTLLVPVEDYMSAHADTGLFDAGIVRWLHSRAAFRHGGAPVYVGPVTVAVLTGARLAHPVVLLRGDDTCAALARQATLGWVAIEINQTALTYARRWVGCLLPRRPAYYDASFVVYAPPGLAAGTTPGSRRTRPSRARGSAARR